MKSTKTPFAVLACISLCMFAQSLFAAPVTTQSSAATGSKKMNVAVINLKSSSGVAAGEADLISDRLRGDLFNTGKVNVMERDQMQEILKEQGFQQSGACTNEACMVEIGQLLGVEQLVTGSLGKVGSMFLVNVRVIDVKTAKIVKVVSVDVKGDIEDVVGNLPSIAAQLVSSGTEYGQTTVVATDKKMERRREEVKEEPKAEDVKKEEPKVEKPAQVEIKDEQAEKNKNRAGIRLGFNIFGSRLEVKRYEKRYYSTGLFADNVTTSFDSGFTKSVFINPQLKFIIKAGPFMTVDIGPTWTYGSIEYKDLYLSSLTNTYYDYKYAHYYNVIGVGLGVNFVKRWYPFKLNVGLTADFNYLLDMESETQDNYINSDSLSFHNAINVAPGIRVGGEIMAGKHVGFNVDFVYRYSYFETFEETTNFDSGAHNDWVYQILMPPIALGLGVNFYF